MVKRRILDDGQVELTYRDERKEIYSQGGITTIYPDGRKDIVQMMQVMPLVPPMPNEPAVNKWLDTLNSNMDDIVKHLINGNTKSFNNYKSSLSPYKAATRINYGMKTIGYLVD